MDYYPLFVDLRGRPCLVVGETRLAEEKAAGLEKAGAVVIRQAEFRPESVGEVFLVVADVDEETAARVLDFSESRRIFANVVDKPAWCSFIMPAVLERGELAVTIGTGGRSPALSGWLKRRLDRELGFEYAALVEALGRTRAEVRERIPSYDGRRTFYAELFEKGFVEGAKSKTAEQLSEEILAFLEAFSPCESSLEKPVPSP